MTSEDITIEKKLLTVCSQHALRGKHGATVAEPYIPFIPDKWNGILVLAEAQNHGDKTYLQQLKSWSPKERMIRLQHYARLTKGKKIGIKPWDDGSLKLAVEAAFGVSADGTAVSNAVLWSLLTEKGTNRNPNDDFCTASVRAWRDMLRILKPGIILTAGSVAKDVIHNVGRGKWKHIMVRLPSPVAMNRVFGMFDVDDLLKRYPEVRTVTDRHPNWANGGFKVFFACHVTSVVKAVGYGEVVDSDEAYTWKEIHDRPSIS